MYQNLVGQSAASAADSVHLTGWPAEETGGLERSALQVSMAVVMRAVDLARTLRAGLASRPGSRLARMWLALPGAELVEREALLALAAEEINVKSIEVIGDESELVDRRVKPLLPKIGKKLGAAIPAVMAAAREGGSRSWPTARSPGRHHPGTRRGRDPGHTPARNRRGSRRGPCGGHRHRADAGAARRGRRPRASARDPGCPQRCRRGARRRGRRPGRSLRCGPLRTRAVSSASVARETRSKIIFTDAAEPGSQPVELDSGMITVGLMRKPLPLRLS